MLQLYDQLLRIAPTPVVALNRAVALAEVEGPGAALTAVDGLDLEPYHLFHAIRADLLSRLDRRRLVEVFYASSHEEAMSHHHKRNGWEPYKPLPGLTDQPFTEDQLAVQEAYLAVRPLK